MAKKCYVGVSDVARNVSKIYVGVNGVARKVVKGYVGVNGVARQFWGDGSSGEEWPFKSSLAETIVTFAYDFIGEIRTVEYTKTNTDLTYFGVSEFKYQDSETLYYCVVVLSRTGNGIQTNNPNQYNGHFTTNREVWYWGIPNRIFATNVTGLAITPDCIIPDMLLVKDSTTQQTTIQNTLKAFVEERIIPFE